jgi:hypothetical protein
MVVSLGVSKSMPSTVTAAVPMSRKLLRDILSLPPRKLLQELPSLLEDPSGSPAVAASESPSGAHAVASCEEGEMLLGH